jgi:hypothetical protein
VHITALFEVQLGPVAATPFEQVQLLVWQAMPSRFQPVLQLAQIAALLAVQSVPVATIPFEQVQALALQAIFESV